MTPPGFAIVPAAPFCAVARKHKLNATDIMVYIALASHIRHSRHVFPSVERLAEITGIPHETHVVRSIGRLVTAGLVTRRRTRNAKGQWDSASYTLADLVSEPLTQSGQWSNHEPQSVGEPAESANPAESLAVDRVTKPGQWTGETTGKRQGNYRENNGRSTDQIRSQPLTRSGQLKRAIEKNKDSPL